MLVLLSHGMWACKFFQTLFVMCDQAHRFQRPFGWNDSIGAAAAASARGARRAVPQRVAGEAQPANNSISHRRRRLAAEAAKDLAAFANAGGRGGGTGAGSAGGGAAGRAAAAAAPAVGPASQSLRWRQQRTKVTTSLRLGDDACWPSSGAPPRCGREPQRGSESVTSRPPPLERDACCVAVSSRPLNELQPRQCVLLVARAEVWRRGRGRASRTRAPLRSEASPICERGGRLAVEAHGDPTSRFAAPASHPRRAALLLPRAARRAWAASFRWRHDRGR